MVRPTRYLPPTTAVRDLIDEIIRRRIVPTNKSDDARTWGFQLFTE